MSVPNLVNSQLAFLNNKSSSLQSSSLQPQIYNTGENSRIQQQISLIKKNNPQSTQSILPIQSVSPIRCIEIIGKVRRFDRRNRKIFWVWTETLQREFKCIVDFFCPVREGDSLHGYVEIEKNNGEDILRFLYHPFVQMSMDRESIIECLIRILRGTGFGEIKANELYDKIMDFSSHEEERGNVITYLSKLSNLWYESKDIGIAEHLVPILNKKQCEKLLTWWYKNRNLRCLYLLGLRKKEIYACNNMSCDQIYKKCIINSFTVVPIPMRICYEIWRRIGKTFTPEQERCGIIARKLYEHNIDKSWVGSPSKFITSAFPDIADRMPMLKEDYGVIGEMFTLYLDYPCLVETSVSQKIYDLIHTKSKYSKESANFVRKMLNDEQKESIQGALDNTISIITGPAGSGKTTIIDEIIHNLELRNISYIIASFTGKAVARIREVIQRRCPGTMNKLIMGKQNVPPFKYLIIDESSMVTTELFYRFGETFNWDFYIVFIGDNNQLQPIGWGSLFQQLIASNIIPTFRLTENHRSKIDTLSQTPEKEKNGILKNAHAMITYGKTSNGYDPDEYIEPFKFESAPNFNIMEGNLETVYEVIKALYKGGVKAIQITTITPYVKFLKPLNERFQQIYNDGKLYATDCKGKIWMVGDRVMMNENNYEINIMNGEEGIITDLIDGPDGEILVNFRDGESYRFKLWYKEDDYEEDDPLYIEKEKLTVKLLMHSFAVTIHKSQGSEWEFVILFIPYENNATYSSFLNKNLIYTAITRAKKAIWVIVGNESSLNASAVTNPSYRCDNLCQRLLSIKEVSPEILLINDKLTNLHIVDEIPNTSDVTISTKL